MNEATAVLYARHVLASLLAEWPNNVPVSEEILELRGPAHMTYILDMFMQLEEKHQWEKVIKWATLSTHLLDLSFLLLPTFILLPSGLRFSAGCEYERTRSSRTGLELSSRSGEHPWCSGCLK